MAAAVAVDATIVRCLLVPAIMSLLGAPGWWHAGAGSTAPSPHLSIEGEECFTERDRKLAAEREKEKGQPPREGPRLGADRGLRPHRRPARPRRWSGGTGRSTGSACPASTPAPASPRSSATRATAAGASPRRRRRRRAAAPLPAGHAGPRDRVRTRADGDGPRHRLHAAARRRPRPGPRGRGRPGGSPMRMRAAAPLRLRRDRAVGARASTAAVRPSPAPTRSALRDAGRASAARTHHGRRVHRRGRRRVPFVAHLAPLAPAGAAAPSTPSGALEQTDATSGAMVGALHLRGPWRGRRGRAR